MPQRFFKGIKLRTPAEFQKAHSSSESVVTPTKGMNTNGVWHGYAFLIALKLLYIKTKITKFNKFEEFFI